jgi:hypothetical protein
MTREPVKPKDYHSKVFFEVKIGQKAAGRLVIKLFQETPRTSENFR